MDAIKGTPLHRAINQRGFLEKHLWEFPQNVQQLLGTSLLHEILPDKQWTSKHFRHADARPFPTEEFANVIRAVNNKNHQELYTALTSKTTPMEIC